MTTTDSHDARPETNAGVLERAARAGFALNARTTDTGQTVWEWCRGDEPRPQFVTVRVALHWMSDWLPGEPKTR